MTQVIYSVLDGVDQECIPRTEPSIALQVSCEAGWALEMQARPATLLGLELLLQEPVVDLGSVVSLLHADVAAALRVAQLAAREVEPEHKAPVRLAECIANLDLSRLLKELSE